MPDTIITIAASHDSLPDGRSLDVGIWIIGGVACGASVPAGLRSLVTAGEQLRERAYRLAEQRVKPPLCGALATLARGQSAALMHPVRSVELFCRLPDGAEDAAESWLVSGPRGPTMTASAWVRDATAPARLEQSSVDDPRSKWG